MFNAIVARLPLLIILTVFMLFVGYLNWPTNGIINGKAAKPSSAVKVKVATVTRSEFKDVIEALGTTKANEAVTLFAQYDGRIKRIHFSDGQIVKKNQILVELHAEEEEAQVRELMANLRVSRAQLSRIENLRKSNSAAQSALESQQAEADAIQAQLEKAKAKLAKLIIRAPFDGVLGQKNISEGAFLSNKDQITTIDDISQIKVDFTVPEKELTRLAIGQKIEARNIAFDNTLFVGSITNIDTRLDPITRSVNVRALIDNMQVRLKPGMLLSLLLERSIEQIILLPENALIPKGDKQYVYKVINKKAILSEVEIGRRRIGDVEITSGLDIGDIVIVKGTVKLRDAINVTIIE